VQAYLTISLDAAGLFRFLAFWVANKGGSSGRKLYLYFWVFFLLLAVAVGNVGSVFFLPFQVFTLIQDPVILSGTPFIAYFTRITGYVVPCSIGESLPTLDSQNTPTNSLDIHAILRCEHGCVYKRLATETHS